MRGGDGVVCGRCRRRAWAETPKIDERAERRVECAVGFARDGECGLQHFQKFARQNDLFACTQAVEAADSTVVVTEQEAGSGQDDGMADLFGQMWPNVQARKPVVITDWTDRAAIRRQREVLVGLGYVLDPATMTWSMPK